jgi:hypothetical protein
MGISIETMAWCADYFATYEVIGSKGDSYEVQINGAEAPPHCTCPAFKYSKLLHCKHVQEVWDRGCFFNPQWKEDGNERPTIRPKHFYYPLIKDKRCVCGGPMIWVQVAV